MHDVVIKSGDSIQITMDPPAIVPALAAPVPLVGTGGAKTVDHQPVCLEGDELPAVLRAPMAYTSPPFVTPGMGTLTLTLTPSNKSQQTTINSRHVLIKGTPFTATFLVSVPAMQPTPGGPVPDPLVSKHGTAQFVTSTTNARIG